MRDRLVRSRRPRFVHLAALGLVLHAHGAVASPPRSPAASDVPADLIAEPAQVTFAPGAGLGHEHATVRLRNGSTFGRDIESIRISGSDWMGFEIVEDVLPDRIPSGADTTIRLRVRPKHFVDDDGDRFAVENYRPIRAGVASLDVVVDGRSLRIPLHFQPAPRRALSPGTLASVLAGLLLFAAATLGLASRDRNRARSRLDVGAWRRQPAAIDLAALLVLVLLPFAPAALDVAAHDVVTLARAQDGLGGTPVLLDPTGLGAATLLGAWTWILVHVARMGAPSVARTPSPLATRPESFPFRQPALFAWIGLVITAVAAGTLATSANLGQIVVAQADVLPAWGTELLPTTWRSAPRVPGWFALSAPWLGLLSIATAVSIFDATSRATRPTPAPTTASPTSTPASGHARPTAALAARSRALVDLAAAATLVTLVWGGPLPAVGTTPTAILVWGVGALISKTLILVVGARALLSLRGVA